MLAPSSALQIETAQFSKTLASINQSTQQFNPKEHYQNQYDMLREMQFSIKPLPLT
jgi:hypothetical protein